MGKIRSAARSLMVVLKGNWVDARIKTCTKWSVMWYVRNLRGKKPDKSFSASIILNLIFIISIGIKKWRKKFLISCCILKTFIQNITKKYILLAYFLRIILLMKDCKSLVIYSENNLVMVMILLMPPLQDRWIKIANSL